VKVFCVYILLDIGNFTLHSIFQTHSLFTFHIYKKKIEKNWFNLCSWSFFIVSPPSQPNRHQLATIFCLQSSCPCFNNHTATIQTINLRCFHTTYTLPLSFGLHFLFQPPINPVYQTDTTNTLPSLPIRILNLAPTSHTTSYTLLLHFHLQNCLFLYQALHIQNSPLLDMHIPITVPIHTYTISH